MNTIITLHRLDTVTADRKGKDTADVARRADVHGKNAAAILQATFAAIGNNLSIADNIITDTINRMPAARHISDAVRGAMVTAIHNGMTPADIDAVTDAARDSYIIASRTVTRTIRTPIASIAINAPTLTAARADARARAVDMSSTYNAPIAYTVQHDVTDTALLYNAAAVVAMCVLRKVYSREHAAFVATMYNAIAAAAAMAASAGRPFNAADIDDADAADVIDVAVSALFDALCAARAADADAVAMMINPKQPDADAAAQGISVASNWIIHRAAYAVVNRYINACKSVRASTAHDDTLDYLRGIEDAADVDAADAYDSMDYSAAVAVADGRAEWIDGGKTCRKFVAAARDIVTPLQWRTLVKYADCGTMSSTAAALGYANKSTVARHIYAARNRMGLISDDAMHDAIGHYRKADADAAADAARIDADARRAAVLDFATLMLPAALDHARADYTAARADIAAADNAIHAAHVAMSDALQDMHSAADARAEFAARAVIADISRHIDAAQVIRDCAAARAADAARRVMLAAADARAADIDAARRAYAAAVATYDAARARAMDLATRARAAVAAVAMRDVSNGRDVYTIVTDADAAAVDTARRLFDAARHAVNAALKSRRDIAARARALCDVAIMRSDARAAAIATYDAARRRIDTVYAADVADAARARAEYDTRIVSIDHIDTALTDADAARIAAALAARIPSNCAARAAAIIPPVLYPMAIPAAIARARVQYTADVDAARRAYRRAAARARRKDNEQMLIDARAMRDDAIDAAAARAAATLDAARRADIAARHAWALRTGRINPAADAARARVHAAADAAARAAFVDALHDMGYNADAHHAAESEYDHLIIMSDMALRIARRAGKARRAALRDGNADAAARAARAAAAALRIRDAMRPRRIARARAVAVYDTMRDNARRAADAARAAYIARADADAARK